MEIFTGLILAAIYIFLKYKFGSKTKKSFTYTSSLDYGMYFMDLHEKTKRNRTDNNSYLISEFYYVIGCASQGRTDEIKEILNESKEKNTELYLLINHFKLRIDRMAKVGKRIEEAEIGYDMKNNESIGEYQSRKLAKSKVFMEEFNFFKNLDLVDYIKNKQF